MIDYWKYVDLPKKPRTYAVGELIGVMIAQVVKGFAFGAGCAAGLVFIMRLFGVGA